MGIFDFFRSASKPTVTKAADDITTTRELVAFLDLDKNTLSGTFDYKKNVVEGYMRNTTAYYCLNLIADAVVSPRWEVYLNEKEVDKEPNKGNPLIGPYRFIQRPNDHQSFDAFLRLAITHYYLAGEAFIRMLPDAKAFARGNGKLVLINPDKVQIDGKFYVINGTQRVPMENPDGTRDILHIRTWHPDSDRGMSRLQPAWLSISNDNQSLRHNHSVLKNGGRLGIVVTLKEANMAPETQITQEALDDLKSQVDKYTKGSNMGSSLVLTGNTEIHEPGSNNKDLEWLKGMEAMKRNIALAFGIDPVLLSLPGDSTYSNKEQALSSLFKNVALPVLKVFVEEIEHWFKSIVKGEWEIRVNLDDVPALEAEREKKWSRQRDAADILTVNERRELLGYEPIEGGDVLRGITEEPVETVEETQEAEDDKPNDDKTEDNEKEE